MAAQNAGDNVRAERLFRNLQANGGPLNDSAKRLETLLLARKQENQTRAKTAYEGGREAYQKGDLVKARALLLDARQLDPEDPAIQRAFERVEEELRRKSP